MVRSDGRTGAKHAVYSKPPAARRGARGSRLAGITLAVAVATGPGCANFNLIPEADDVKIGQEAYSQILAGEKVVAPGVASAEVHGVMQRLVAVANKPQFPWEVQVLDAPETVNAFCLPGGKMAVYTGILPVAGGEAGLAVVMGHEVAHALERHGTERMSRQMVTQGLLEELLGGGEYEELGSLAAHLVLELPYSRNDELEADAVGLFLMADAGYDPREAIEFWRRMADLGGASPPEFLSTHPADGTRIAQLQELMPQALARYQSAGGP